MQKLIFVLDIYRYSTMRVFIGFVFMGLKNRALVDKPALSFGSHHLAEHLWLGRGAPVFCGALFENHCCTFMSLIMNEYFAAIFGRLWALVLFSWGWMPWCSRLPPSGWASYSSRWPASSLMSPSKCNYITLYLYL